MQNNINNKNIINIKIKIYKDLNNYDRKCIKLACEKFCQNYSNLFNLILEDHNDDLNLYHCFPKLGFLNKTQVCVRGENLLMDLAKFEKIDIIVLLINIPIFYEEKQIMPFAMFYYDEKKKTGSVLISVDILFSPKKREYIKNILVNLEHEIGEMLVGEHCSNRECPLYFHHDVSEIRYSSTRYCSVCFNKILKNLNNKFK